MHKSNIQLHVHQRWIPYLVSVYECLHSIAMWPVLSDQNVHQISITNEYLIEYSAKRGQIETRNDEFETVSAVHVLQKADELTHTTPKVNVIEHVLDFDSTSSPIRTDISPTEFHNTDVNSRTSPWLSVLDKIGTIWTALEGEFATNAGDILM